MKMSVLQILLSVHLIFSRSAVNGQKHLEVTQPEMVQAEAGETVTISCSFLSMSPSYTAIWSLGCDNTAKLQDLPCFQHRVKYTYQDVVQTPQSPEVSSYEMKTTLTITNVTENDSGRFCCHIKTADGERGTGQGSRLEVTRRPCPEDIYKSTCSDSINMVPLLVEIIKIIGLIILIVLLGIAVKTSC